MKLFKLFLFSLLLSSNSHAYLSIAESAEVLAPGKYQVGFEPQFMTSKGTGANFNVFLDTSIDDSTSARISMGAGVVDFNTFASIKWIPYPDFENQPAIGVRGGVGIARKDGLNVIEIQATPLVSKRYDTAYGLAVPYFAVPVTYIDEKTSHYVAANVSFGSEFHHMELPDAVLGAEIGLDMNKSSSYISIFASFPFESHKGFGK